MDTSSGFEKLNRNFILMGIDCLLAHLLTMLSTKGYPICVQPHPSTLGHSMCYFGRETLLTPSTGQSSGIVWQPHCVP